MIYAGGQRARSDVYSLQGILNDYSLAWHIAYNMCTLTTKV